MSDDTCELIEDAPFCAGPSMKECPNGIEVPETEECGTAWTNDTVALGEPASAHKPPTREGSCELDGTCDDSCSPPARDDCLVESTQQPSPPPQQQLPQTGIEATMLTLALALIVTGLVMIGYTWAGTTED